jgi:DNA polymerase III delta prime subunit
MKFYDTHYEDYLRSEAMCPLHPKLTSVYNKFPDKLCDMKNLIFYGPKGVGKYTQMLKAISRYSQSSLKYDKKIIAPCNKTTYVIRISDIHFEIDMSLLGCNSKALWNELYSTIVDAILAKSDHTGIIVCKYFHEIHSELLDGFYSYMQTLSHNSLNIKFILLTEELSFIPDAIIERCRVVRVPRPSRAQYNKCLENKVSKDIPLGEITNMKNINASVRQLMRPYEVLCNDLVDMMIQIDTLKYMEMRDKLYDLLIYSLDITECIWYILDRIITLDIIKEEEIPDVMLEVYRCLQYYNNNYRPIYHLESLVFYLVNKIHGFTEGV